MIDLREHLQSSIGTSVTIERELGGGGMSRVFVADDERSASKDRHQSSQRRVGARGCRAERFEREILLAAGLQHPYIVPVLDAGTLDGLPYYTMPFVEGQSRPDGAVRCIALPIRRGQHSARRRGGAGVRARARCGPSRHQTRERAAERTCRARHGFWNRQGVVGRRVAGHGDQ